MSVQIKNLTTEKIYRSIQAAAKEIGVTHTSIHNAINTGSRCKGSYWQRLDREPMPAKKIKRNCPVVNCATGEVFENAIVAAASIGVLVTTLRTAIYAATKVKGVYWDWNDD
jgi:hypothetical protein